MWVYKYLFQFLLSVPLGTYPEVELPKIDFKNEKGSSSGESVIRCIQYQQIGRAGAEVNNSGLCIQTD